MNHKLMRMGFLAIAPLLLSKYGVLSFEDALHLTAFFSALIMYSLFNPMSLLLVGVAAVLMLYFNYLDLELDFGGILIFPIFIEPTPTAARASKFNLLSLLGK